MTDQTFGPFQTAANKLLKFAIDNKVSNAGDIKIDGQLGAEWTRAFDAIFVHENMRSSFDYGVLREVRDSLTPLIGRHGFVGQMGQTDDRFQFIGLLQRLAREEAQLKIISWERHRDELRAKLHALLDWRKRGELLNWA